MQPELEEAVRESVVTMQQIAEDTVRYFISVNTDGLFLSDRLVDI